MKKNKEYVQECSDCNNIWVKEKIETRCPHCGSYHIIVDVEWEEVDA